MNIVKFLINSRIYNANIYFKPSNSFVILKLFKKFQQKQKRFKPKAQTYSSQTRKEQQKEKYQQDSPEADYDFFSRQKQAQLSKDFRKIRQQTQYIPSDIGKGGFDEIVYWSQFAKTPEQIRDLIKLFNRTQVPQQISDLFRFQQFIDKVLKTVYLSADFNTLQQFATFGQKFDIRQKSYWKKIEQKTIRLNPKTPQQIKDCIQIAFIMSKLGQGELIYSSLSSLFKDLSLTPQDTGKLLIAYANKEVGEREWVQKLMTDIIQSINKVRKQILIQLLNVFKKSKTIPDILENKILRRIQEEIPTFDFKQICIAGGYVVHGKMPNQFWEKIQKRTIEVLPKSKTMKNAIYLLQMISNYSISVQFVRKYFIPILRNEDGKVLNQMPPQILSCISKILYIYELENQTKDIEQKIQSRIMKIFNSLKDVSVQNLIKVIKDYNVTRIGSRELYIFLEQVANALFQQIKQNRQHLQMLCVLYEKSELCSPQFLQKLQSQL